MVFKPTSKVMGIKYLQKAIISSQGYKGILHIYLDIGQLAPHT